MKKTIVIIILVVFIASIAVVNFFGLEIKQFESVNYVTAIQCDTVIFHGDNSKVLQPSSFVGKEGKTPYFIFDYIPADPENPYTMENLESNPNIVQVNYEVMPHLADESGVVFEYDIDSGIAVYHELSGSFIFLKPDLPLTITIRATDGSNVSTQIRIKGSTTAAK